MNNSDFQPPLITEGMIATAALEQNKAPAILGTEGDISDLRKIVADLQQRIEIVEAWRDTLSKIFAGKI